MLAESSRWQISSGPQPTPLERQAEDHVEGEWIGGAPVRRPVEAKHKVAFHKVGFDRKPGFTVKAISLGRSTTVGTNSRSKYILPGPLTVIAIGSDIRKTSAIVVTSPPA
jgi:hypothetical protein